jgi:hypothetical protein
MSPFLALCFPLIDEEVQREKKVHEEKEQRDFQTNGMVKYPHLVFSQFLANKGTH